MPLIRYRTGDLSRFIPGACPCGTCLKTLERVHTRITGRIPVVSRGHLSIADLDEVLFSLENVYNYTAIITHKNEYDILKLNVYAIKNENLDQQILAALEKIPDIRLARKNDRLFRQIEMQTDRPNPTSFFKRTIQEIDAFTDESIVK